MHNYVEEDLRKEIDRQLEKLLPELQEDLEMCPINQFVISALTSYKAIFEELRELEHLAYDLHKKEIDLTMDIEDMLSLKGILTCLWINQLISVRLDCVDEDVLQEVIKTADRVLRIKKAPMV